MIMYNDCAAIIIPKKERKEHTMDKLFIPGDILLPKNLDLGLWSVIACDQFTSQPEYWDQVDQKVGSAPSTLRLILPEAYLESKDVEEEAEKINHTMAKYLKDEIFTSVPDSYIYIERVLTDGGLRRGLLGLIDLEAYDYKPNSSSPVRATERTVEERLPPRVRVRARADIELSHIIVFVDDPDDTVFKALAEDETLYDFELMYGGGRIKGSRVCGAAANKVQEALARLSDPEHLKKRYALDGKAPVVIAMGDGNHSLAAAKLYWEEMKKEFRHSPEKLENSPARFGLAELVNIHDSTVVFEPIHRVIFGTKPDQFFEKAREFFKNANAPGESSHEITLSRGGQREDIKLTGLTIGDVVSVVQKFCEEYASAHGGRIDYIHDNDTALEMSDRAGCSGLLLPAMDKSELFGSVMKSGVFPAKSFSIGPARDKRYYLECRKIKD